MIPHVGYGYVMYDWQNIESFTQKTERTQYSATFAITITIKRISKSTLHSELGFESLIFKRCFRKLCTPFKIKATGLSCPQAHRLSSASKGTSCANLHDLQQSHCGDNREGHIVCTFVLYIWFAQGIVTQTRSKRLTISIKISFVTQKYILMTPFCFTYIAYISHISEFFQSSILLNLDWMI